MQNLQTFNFEDLPVRTLTVDDEPYFVGNDVAQILGYEDYRGAINKKVDSEDKLRSQIDHAGQKRSVTLINESGLYSLIFSSKLDSAKRFKRWVTSEVLPTIRKTGTYQVPSDPMQALELMFEATKQTKEEIESVKADVIDLKDNQKLDAGEYGLVTKTIHQRVAYIRQIHGLPNSKEVNKPLYQNINNDVNTMAGIKTRTQLRQKHFNDVMDIISNWFPSQSTMYVIRQLEMDFEEGGK
ncbi:ORF6C domain-containing protein [Staphylococcus pseudintermedius]|uniref:ORF6C domain-containing protein n=1 Tax=Staphylococcus delphini TaxID=53344 RepID=A0AAQ0IFG5_9STAP|nr:BRO family protein [Staphylococcus delphini]EIQ4140781.1 ORF6C domain-containing protein [Staphylococcus pseudintermedius]MCE5656277.1 ORF6C domain-containing protein [Staphylococcus pseudintermedius]MCE5822956.1 ORF6C domain-containing protein [Staphylococcus pseudintermedius]QUM66210.1 ORF6C domain-containing protein [Staphylococcus delphini]QUM68646.1 ORF6C domain-containing protein [Staphylococcus delphini]